jgi:flavin-dependent dehydrogenase
MHLRTFAKQTDVLIAGAGPAGLACAITCALQGLSVQVADAMEPPIDKACGEGILPDGLKTLASFGLDLVHTLNSHQAHPLHGIRFLGDHGATVEAAFNSHGCGIRRPILHQLLLDRAIALGVRFHWKNSVQSIEPSPGNVCVRTNRQCLTTRFLVGADGHHSRIATWAGLGNSRVRSRRIGLRQHYSVTPWSSFVEVYWGRHGQAYVTPTSPNEICVAFVSAHKFENPAQTLALYPSLAARLENAAPSGSSRGSITLGRTVHRVTTGNIALIGDASGSVDAITGEGLALGFRQAVALASALKDNHLAAYQHAHRRIQRLPRFMSRSLLLMDRSPRLRDHALNVFQHNPWLFKRLLQIHIGHTPRRLFGVDGPLQPGYTC